ncbi:MAG TPA: asparagine synthase (glutamine-hydrolyzing) [Cyclobacteriaceae bacterium]|nr:asparagine synthase (glutamine-hydrolyzing) [Cyclobacteriaceae bacterium]
MCGIIGVISNDSIEHLTPHLRNSCDAIRHRGPDDEGLEHFGRAFLGFRRLAIIDLSQNGHQPMQDASGRYWIIFNGEIYNFLDIKQKLIAKGYSFKSNSDTEVILYAYIEYGGEMVKMIEGMFSLIIYDKTQHSFFAARDRMGKKPMLIFQQGQTIFLFSELKQIIGIPGFDKSVNFQAINDYLTYGAIPQPNTIFKNVSALPAGHYLKVINNQVSIKQYWGTEFRSDTSLTYDDAKDRVRYLVENAVKKRLISDVPLGAFLSGGIDSTIIVGLMKKFSTSRIKTFSITYNDANSSFDESSYAELVAKKFETEHNSIKIGPSEVLNEIDKIVWHMDQPSSDAINTYFVSMSARKGVTVALSGVGADELFAGYSTFKFVNLIGRLRGSTSLNRFNRIVTDLFYKIPLTVSASWKVRGAFSIAGAFPRTVDRYNLIKQIYYNMNVDQLLLNHNDHNGQPHRSLVDQYFENSLTDIQRVTNAEINNYMTNTLLRDSDVMGMAHSLEIRAPFVDHHLVEFTNTLPDQFKIQNVKTKVILKDAFSDILPHEVVHRKKMGFTFPLTIWLKKGKLRDIVEDCLSEESIRKRGWLDYNPVTVQKNNFFNLQTETPNSFQSYQRVWTLVVLELWARKFIDAG